MRNLLEVHWNASDVALEGLPQYWVERFLYSQLEKGQSQHMRGHG